MSKYNIVYSNSKKTSECGTSNVVIEHCIRSLTVINLQKRYVYKQLMERDFGGIWLIWPLQKQVGTFSVVL